MASWDTSEVNRLAIDLSQAPLSVQAKVSDAIGKRAKRIESAGKRRAPVLTGALRASIHAEIGIMQADIGSDLRYAHFVEFGDGHGGPQPYMGPAFTLESPGLQKDVQDAAGDFL